MTRNELEKLSLRLHSLHEFLGTSENPLCVVEATDFIRAYLAQEPVAWMYREKGYSDYGMTRAELVNFWSPNCQPLYPSLLTEKQ